MPSKEQWIARQEGNCWQLLSSLIEEAGKTGEEILPREALQINVDTRDFAIYCRFNPAEIDEDRGIVSLIKNPKLIKEDFCITIEEIIPWLQKLEQWAGGYGDWRHLNFCCPTVSTAGFWDFKYIRFYVHPSKEGVYIVCNKDSKAIRWRDLEEKHVDKDDLHLVVDKKAMIEQLEQTPDNQTSAQNFE